MKYTKYQSGAKVLKQSLTYEVSGVTSAVLARFSEVFDPGIVADVLEEMAMSVGSNSTAASPSVTVGTGIAYTVAGDRVLIDDAALHNAANPSTTTPDGLGGNTLTPLSTGCANIPLTADANHFVWLDHIDTVDPSEFTLHKVTGQKLFYAVDDGYQLGVSDSGTTQPAGFSDESLLLGLVITSSLLTSGVSSINQVSMPNFGTQLQRVKSKTPLADRSDITSVYGPGQVIFLEDHVKAIGSASITPTNPHGLSAIDLNIADPGGVEHQKFFHGNGISSLSAAGGASALYLQEHTSGIASDNYVEVFPLIASEAAIVDGELIDSVNIPATLQFRFVDNIGDPLADGTYTLYLDNALKTVQMVASDIFDLGDASKQRIWTVEWANPTIVGGAKRDYRLFGAMSPRNINFEFVGAMCAGIATGNRSLTFSYNTDGTLSQMGLGGDNGTIAGSISFVTFSYSSGHLVQASGGFGPKTAISTLTFSGDTLTQITEQML